jgi:hypothetical protein
VQGDGGGSTWSHVDSYVDIDLWSVNNVGAQGGGGQVPVPLLELSGIFYPSLDIRGISASSCRISDIEGERARRKLLRSRMIVQASVERQSSACKRE